MGRELRPEDFRIGKSDGGNGYVEVLRRLPAGCELEVLNSPIRQKKLFRSGDMGADPPGCFEPAEDGTVLQTLKCRFRPTEIYT